MQIIIRFLSGAPHPVAHILKHISPVVSSLRFERINNTYIICHKQNHQNSLTWNRQDVSAHSPGRLQEDWNDSESIPGKLGVLNSSLPSQRLKMMRNNLRQVYFNTVSGKLSHSETIRKRPHESKRYENMKRQKKVCTYSERSIPINLVELD